jgi:hypothetical protein
LHSAAELYGAHDSTLLSRSSHSDRDCAFEHSRSGENEVALDERSGMGRLWVPQADTGAFFDDTVSRCALTL